MPNTREKLIELIQAAKSKKQYDFLFGNIDDAIDMKSDEEYIADHLIANGVTVQQWIPVSERLPELGQPCLCYKKTHGHPEYRLGTYIGATFSKNCAAFKSMSHFGCIGATHWMPLPEPPKGE